MSIEETLSKLTASQNTLADAMTRYADVMEAYLAKGGAVNITNIAKADEDGDGDGDGKTTTRAAKKATKKATKKRAAAPKDDDDGFDGDGDENEEEEEEEEEDVTLEDVKASLIALKKHDNDKARGLKLIGKYGYEAIPEIQPKHFAVIKKAADKMAAE